MVLVLFKLRARGPAPFEVPLYPVLPLVFLIVYVLLFAAAVIQGPMTTAIAVAALGLAYVIGYSVTA
jgi:hypothetical protein